MNEAFFYERLVLRAGALAALMLALAALPYGKAAGEEQASGKQASDEHAGNEHANTVWKYVVPASGEPMEHPPLVPLTLSEKRPDLVEAEPSYQSDQPRYGLLRYGNSTSTQVVVVLDDRGGEFDLYVNANRSPALDTKHVATGEGRIRRASVPSHINNLTVVEEEYPREVVFRRGLLPGSIGVATLGYLEGTVSIDGKPVAARRVDGDANGLFSDARDRLWLDLNGDGKWDPFSEQFPLKPVLALAGKRYAVRTDQAGTRLGLEEITGVGTLKLQLATLPDGTEVRHVEVALMGDDGSAYAARADGAAITVPAGRYAVRSLRLSVRDAARRKPWNFQFTRYDVPKNKEYWHEVAAGEEVTVDPCGPLRLAVEGSQLEKPVHAGQTLSVDPRLYTAQGLLINSCDFHEKPAELGDTSNQNQAEVSLCQTDGTRVSVYHSGFA